LKFDLDSAEQAAKEEGEDKKEKWRLNAQSNC
jgi:hypothetical protein